MMAVLLTDEEHGIMNLIALYLEAMFGGSGKLNYYNNG